MRLTTAHHRTGHARIGVPAAFVGVLATAFAAPTPAIASSDHLAPLPADSGTASESGLASLSGIASLPGIVPQTFTGPATVPTASQAPTSYTVQSGDTVFAIAQRFGLATVDVLSWNGLGWRSVIHPGQTLMLSAPVAAAPAEAPAPAPAAESSSAAAIHTVVAGDTIFAIAQRHGTTVDAVLAANGMEQGSIIYPGQRIIVSAPPVTTAQTPTLTTPTVPSTQLNAPQAENAGLIIRIGRELGVSDRGIAIALGTSMVESWLRNLDWGDRDSLGLFQQRPSTGWGTAEQLMDRDYSIRAFFTGVSGPDGTITRGLLDIPGWEGMAFADAAQAVQISAHPERYAPWEAAAYEWLTLYG